VRQKACVSPHTLEPSLDPGVDGPEIPASSSNLQLPSAHTLPPRHGEPVRDPPDWLHLVLGFQRDNVLNQREPLILLLANAHIRLGDPRPEPLNTVSLHLAPPSPRLPARHKGLLGQGGDALLLCGLSHARFFFSFFLSFSLGGLLGVVQLDARAVQGSV